MPAKIYSCFCSSCLGRAWGQIKTLQEHLERDRRLLQSCEAEHNESAYGEPFQHPLQKFVQDNEVAISKARKLKVSAMLDKAQLGQALGMEGGVAKAAGAASGTLGPCSS